MSDFLRLLRHYISLHSLPGSLALPPEASVLLSDAQANSHLAKRIVCEEIYLAVHNFLSDCPADCQCNLKPGAYSPLYLSNEQLQPSLSFFSSHQFSHNIEEEYLATLPKKEVYVYSLLRVSDPDLLTELWLQAQESESSFLDLALSYGEGPESCKAGIVGPLQASEISPPVFLEVLKDLKVGSFSAPFRLANWSILLFLLHRESPALDGSMKSRLLESSLNSYIESRASLLLKTDNPSPITIS